MQIVVNIFLLPVCVYILLFIYYTYKKDSKRNKNCIKAFVVLLILEIIFEIIRLFFII